MADNFYIAFGPVFWSYHSNIDRIFEIWLRSHTESMTVTPLFPLRPFASARAEGLEFTDPRTFVYTCIGDLAKDSRALGFDFGPPAYPDFGTQAVKTKCLSATGLRGLVSAVAQPEELLALFDGVRCTFNSYAVDVFLNQTDPAQQKQSTVALADPAGLYIQTPDFSSYALPSDPNLPKGATAADCWQIVRGQSVIEDPLTPGTNYPGNFILHVAFQLPSAWIEAGVSFTVGDITIRSQGVASPVTYAGQIAQTMHIALFARPIPASTDASAYPCLGSPTTNTVQPVQMMYQNHMRLASNTVVVHMQVKVGQTFTTAIVCLDAVRLGSTLPAVSVDGGGIVFTSISLDTVSYAAPGNSYPSSFLVLSVSGAVSKTAATGLRNIAIANPGQSAGPFAPAMLFVS